MRRCQRKPVRPNVLGVKLDVKSHEMIKHNRTRQYNGLVIYLRLLILATMSTRPSIAAKHLSVLN